MQRGILFSLWALLLSVSPLTNAEQARQFGDYAIHYSAFTTDVLTPDVARSYNITRSKSRAMVNISVLKRVMDTTVQPVRAEVSAVAINLSAQMKNLDFREVNDQGAIYYITETPVIHRETLRFQVSVTPEGESRTFEFTFDQEFFTD